MPCGRLPKEVISIQSSKNSILGGGQRRSFTWFVFLYYTIFGGAYTLVHDNPQSNSGVSTVH